MTLRLQPELGGALALHEDLAPAASTSCERSASIATVHGADRASTVAVHSERTACPSGPRAGMFVSSTTLRSAGLAWSALNARHRKILIVCFQSFWARAIRKRLGDLQSEYQPNRWQESSYGPAGTGAIGRVVRGTSQEGVITSGHMFLLGEPG